MIIPKELGSTKVILDLISAERIQNGSIHACREGLFFLFEFKFS